MFSSSITEFISILFVVNFHPLRRKSSILISSPALFYKIKPFFFLTCLWSSDVFKLLFITPKKFITCCFSPTIANGQSAGSPVAFQPKTTKRASTESGRTSKSGELPYLTFRGMVYGLSLYCRDLLYGTLCYDRQYVCFQLIHWLFPK